MSDKEQAFLNEIDEKIKRISRRFWSIIAAIVTALILTAFGWVTERAVIKNNQQAQELRIRDIEQSYVSKYNFDYLSNIYSLQTEEMINRLEEILGLMTSDDARCQVAIDNLGRITEQYTELRNALLFKVEIGAVRGGEND
jgi:hypothetical protein